MNNKKTNLTVTFTNTQHEMLDFITFVLNHDMINKSNFFVDCMRSTLKNYIGFPDDLEASVPDNKLLEIAQNKNEALIKSIMGEENWNKFQEGDDQ